jgi:hypothetical protein
MLRFKFSVLNGEKVQGSREKGSRFKVRSLMRTRIRWRGKETTMKAGSLELCND